MSEAAGGVADLRPLARAREQRAWYWYDWANSAFATTVAGVLFAPYLIAIAKEAAVDNRVHGHVMDKDREERKREVSRQRDQAAMGRNRG